MSVICHKICVLSGGSIGNDGFKCFILALDSFTSLRILKVACCRLTCVSLQCLAEKLMQYTNMKPLQVSVRGRGEGGGSR